MIKKIYIFFITNLLQTMDLKPLKPHKTLSVTHVYLFYMTLYVFKNHDMIFLSYHPSLLLYDLKMNPGATA